MGDVLLVGPPQMEPDQKNDFRFDVALNEPQVAEGDPIIELVQQTTQFVNGVINQLCPFLK
ncbi:MAG TPA: hypothetical protein VF252_08745 [Gemmatimonadales bacterium]